MLGETVAPSLVGSGDQMSVVASLLDPSVMQQWEWEEGRAEGLKERVQELLDEWQGSGAANVSDHSDRVKRARRRRKRFLPSPFASGSHNKHK